VNPRPSAPFVAGRHPWGVLEVHAGRFGVVHYRLTVYPPGTNATERRDLILARDWPALGGAATLLTLIVLGARPSAFGVALAAIAVWAAGVVWTRSRTATTRRAIRALDGVRVADGVRDVSRGDFDLIVDCVTRLQALDRSGTTSDPVTYEAGWTEVYRMVDAASTVRAVSGA